MKKFLIVFFIGFVFVLGVSAQFWTGNDLIAGWQAMKNNANGKSYDSNEMNFFVGYVSAVVDSYMNIIFSPPSNATVRQLCMVCGKYLDANPKVWSLSGADIVAMALQEAFPLK